ncbi:MAG: hypothetical protein AMXMBFR64_52260 [Myxococcales bacterium]
MACPADGTPTLDEAPFTADRDPLVGQTFDGRFEVLARIGKGGMGSVYRARQLSMGREVALKVLNPGLTGDAEAAGRFVREAKVASRLRHTNTIVLYDFGQAPEGLYMAMELLDGETLTSRIRSRGCLTPQEAARIASAIARSLSEAHAQGIVHRDLKSDNIYLHREHGGGEVVKVLDFGIAKFVQEQISRTQSAVFETNRPIIAGTIGYLSPEQGRGAPIDGRADLYALGVIMYRMLTGTLPFNADTPIALLRLHIEELAPDLPPAIPEPLRDLVRRMLAKRPEDRPPTADAVADALDAFVKGPQASAPALTAAAADMHAVATRIASADNPFGTDPHGDTAHVPRSPGMAPGETAAMPWDTQLHASMVTRPWQRKERSEEPAPRSVVGPLLGLLLFMGLLGVAGWYGYQAYFGRGTCGPGLYETCRVECEGGNAEACQVLAGMVARGEGTTADPARAVSLQVKACEGGIGAACRDAGNAYATPTGVTRDLTRAAELLRKGCDAGDGESCAELAEQVERGRGVKKDRDDAIALRAKACKAGVKASCDR